MVRDIIAATKALEGAPETAAQEKVPKADVLLASKQTKALEKEISQLRESIQTLCRSANPLGKTMDYVQEDFENMTKELDKWRAEASGQQLKLEEEKL